MTMKINLILSDDDYRRILATPKRVRGTICQNSPEEFCFRAYSESNESEQLPKRQFKTKHSTTTVNSKRIRLYMSIPREPPTRQRSSTTRWTMPPASWSRIWSRSLTPNPLSKGEGSDLLQAPPTSTNNAPAKRPQSILRPSPLERG